MKDSHFEENSLASCGERAWPEDGIEEVSACPVCGAQRRRLLYEDLTDRIFFCAPGKWSMYACGECGTVYLDPRPNQAAIGLAYSVYFTHQQGNDVDVMPKGLVARLRRLVGNSYRNWRYGTSTRPSFPLGFLLALLMPEKRRAIDASMRHMPKPNSGARLLDFGCGNGEFLEVIKNAGWEVRGIDFDLEAVKAAKHKGLDVIQGGVDELAQFDGMFDQITLSHVIEHVHQPERLLSLCYRALKPDGRLWLETPNINAQGHEKYGVNWRGLEPPRHLMLFNQQSLTLLLNKAGFQRIEIMPHNPVIPTVFGASEAIEAGEDPWTQAGKWASLLQHQWKTYREAAAKDPMKREFLTVAAIK